MDHDLPDGDVLLDLPDGDVLLDLPGGDVLLDLSGGDVLLEINCNFKEKTEFRFKTVKKYAVLRWTGRETDELKGKEGVGGGGGEKRVKVNVRSKIEALESITHECAKSLIKRFHLFIYFYCLVQFRNQSLILCSIIVD